MNPIAAFDFDGTITKRDTLLPFLLFSFGYFQVGLGFLFLSWTLTLYRIGIISNGVAKEHLFAYFFKGMSKGKFESLCHNFSSVIDGLENQQAIEKISWHKDKGHQVVIVSASISNWIMPWANEKKVDMVLGTEIEIVENRLTGKFSTPNCYGQEKVNRLKSAFPELSKAQIYAYGDSGGDKEMLSISTYPYFKSF